MHRVDELSSDNMAPARSKSTPPGNARRLSTKRTPSKVLYNRQKAMISSLQKVQKQYEQQRADLLSQWAEARVLWEDERSFLIDERDAVMVEYKNIAVEKVKLQKELSQVLHELSGDVHILLSKTTSTSKTAIQSSTTAAASPTPSTSSASSPSSSNPPSSSSSSPSPSPSTARTSSSPAGSSKVPDTMETNRPACSFTSHVLSNHFSNDTWTEYVAELRLGSLCLCDLDTCEVLGSIVVYGASATATSSISPTTEMNLAAVKTGTWKQYFTIHIDQEPQQKGSINVAIMHTNTKNVLLAVNTMEDRDLWIEHINNICGATNDATQAEHESYLMRSVYEKGGSELCEAVNNYLKRCSLPAQSPTIMENKSAPLAAEQHLVDQKNTIDLIRPLARIQPSPVNSSSAHEPVQQEETKQQREEQNITTPTTVRANRARISGRLEQLRKRMDSQKHWESILTEKIVEI